MSITLAGHKVPNWALWSAGIGSGLVLVLYLRSRGGTASTNAGTSSADQVDPITGLTDAQDIAEYGSVAAADQAAGAGGGGGGGGYYATGGGASYGGTAGYPTANVTSPASTTAYPTNAAWSQAATAGLAALGYSSTAISAALGLYFAGAPLTADQASIVQAAIAEFGAPPDGTYSIVSSPSSGGAVAGTGGGATDSGGSGTDGSSSTGSPAAGSSIGGSWVVSNSGGDVVIGWMPVGPATSWNVTRTGPGGTVTNHVTKPEATYENLARGHNFEIRIQPLPSGTVGGIDFKTN